VVVKDLVDVGLWHEPGHDCDECDAFETGYLVHGYLERNPTAAQERARRKADRERKARHRAKGSEAVDRGSSGAFQARHAVTDEGTNIGTDAGTDSDSGRESRRDGRRPSPATRPRTRTSTESLVSEVRLPPPACDDEEDDRRLIEACRVIAGRRLERRGRDKTPIVDSGAWLRKTAGDRLAEHKAAAAAVLAAHPDLTADELADELEPDLRPPRAPAPLCGECEGGWILTDDGARRCPCQEGDR
jgi:hypothetical protein